MLSETEKGILLQESLKIRVAFTIQGPKEKFSGCDSYIDELKATVIDAVNIMEITSKRVTIIFRNLNDASHQIREDWIKNILESIRHGGIESGGDKGYNVFSIKTENATSVVIEPPV